MYEGPKFPQNTQLQAPTHKSQDITENLPQKILLRVGGQDWDTI